MWKSLGVEPRRLAPGLLAAFLILLPAAARADTGEAAFARQDYVAAAGLWRAEAATGSAEAKLGLGLIHDLGLGVPRSSAAALRWYLEAAGDGLADAQFNVGVMLDAGTGAPRDAGAAATWYARAAAKGHARAQYNLGLLYESGIGVPRNPDLARAWFEAARPAISAAANRLEGLAPSPTGDGDAPRPVTGALVGPRSVPRAELVWIAGPGRGAFEVQIARGPSEGDIVLSRGTDLSAIALDLAAEEGELAWRVGRTGGAGAAPAWSPWRDLPWQDDAGDPLQLAQPSPGRLTIQVSAGDGPARAFRRGTLGRLFQRGPGSGGAERGGARLGHGGRVRPCRRRRPRRLGRGVSAGPGAGLRRARPRPQHPGRRGDGAARGRPAPLAAAAAPAAQPSSAASQTSSVPAGGAGR